jgi:hypothetical protein
MARVSDIANLLPERIIVGPSAIVGVTAFVHQSFVNIKILSGGSLEIGGTYALSSGATTAFTWGNGYLLGATEILGFNATGNFFLAATGATVTVFVLRQQGPGGY